MRVGIHLPHKDVSCCAVAVAVLGAGGTVPDLGIRGLWVGQHVNNHYRPMARCCGRAIHTSSDDYRRGREELR